MNTRANHTWKAASMLLVLTVLALTTLFAAPAPVALAANTGYRSPTADYVYTIGFTNPDYAYTDDDSYASRGSPANGVAHLYGGYGFSIPDDAAIQGIEVRLDWWLNSTAGTNAILVYLSWDGGTTWTASRSATTERTSDGNPTDIVGGVADTWGRTWGASELSDDNFYVRLELSTGFPQQIFYLDWVPVQVTYSQPPDAPTNQIPAGGAFVASGNPEFTWSDFSYPDAGDTQASFQVQLRAEAGAYGDAESQDSGTVASVASTYTPSSWDLGDGAYCWHVRVQDDQGAWSAYSSDTCFTVDRIAPTSTATAPDYANGSPVAVAWTAGDDAGGSGVSTVALWYRLDAGDWTDSGMSQSGSAGTFDFDPPGGANGTYYFQTIATDVAGNVEAGPAGDGHDSTVYDTTPPTSQAAPPAGPISAPPIAIPWTADDALSGIATDGILLRYNLNGGAYADGPTASGTSGTFDFAPPGGGGTYCFYTIATDRAGNVELPPGGAEGDGCTILNAPPVAVDDSYSTAKNMPLTVPAPGVLANDTDADNDPLTALLVAGPASGTLALNADGSFLYTPVTDFIGVVDFTYQASDGMANSNVATVTIAVTLANDPPVAVNDSYSTSEDTPLTIPAPGVLANDTDADGDPLTAILVAGPANGTLALNPDGSFTYTPAPDWNGVVTFTYQANDGKANSNVATVTLTVTPVNDAPTFTSTPVTSATEDTVYTYNVTVADVDNPVTGLTITALTRPGWLALTDNGDGTATLAGIPAYADIGDHPVVLRVSDGAAAATQSFTITVSAKGMYYLYLPAIFRN